MVEPGKDNYGKILLKSAVDDDEYCPDSERYYQYLDKMKEQLHERHLKFSMKGTKSPKNIFQLSKQSKDGDADIANGIMCSQFVAEALDQSFDIFDIESAALYPWRLNNIL
ncbi:MAG: hypothetical protein GY874_05635 [Desulfobacteraceae bacterium]|nr:hypothetical protein [Desulfobacteraceae bacterium]